MTVSLNFLLSVARCELRRGGDNPNASVGVARLARVARAAYIRDRYDGKSKKGRKGLERV